MKSRIITCIVLAMATAGCTRQSERTGSDALPKRHVVKKPLAERRAGATPASATQKVLLGSPKLLAGIPGDGPVTVAEMTRWLADKSNHAPLEIELPMWLKPGAGQAKDLKDNPMTRAKLELGRQLFFDKRLSADNSISCASCHEPEYGYTIDEAVATGINGQKGKRNPPTLLNRVMLSLGHDKQFWDGRSDSVEDALLHALSDPSEMAASVDKTVEKLNKIEGYRLEFDEIYGEITWDSVGDAIGCFVRNLVTDPSTYDYYARWQGWKDADPEDLKEDVEYAAAFEEAKANAEAHPMSESAQRGEYLFFGNKAWCSACHNGVNFTDELYHNTGIGLDADDPDLGRYNVTKRPQDWGAFKTPTIRGAIYTAPYMHDGSLRTLEDVIEWYAHEGLANRNLDYRYKRIEGEELTAQDKRDLVEFVKACSGPLPKVETGRLPE